MKKILLFISFIILGNNAFTMEREIKPKVEQELNVELCRELPEELKFEIIKQLAYLLVASRKCFNLLQEEIGNFKVINKQLLCEFENEKNIFEMAEKVNNNFDEPISPFQLAKILLNQEKYKAFYERYSQGANTLGEEISNVIKLEIDNCVRNNYQTTADNIEQVKDKIKTLTKLGANLDVKDEEGETVLHILINWSRYLEVIKLLIKAGINLAIKNNDDYTVVDKVNLGKIGCLKLLFEVGANFSNDKLINVLAQVEDNDCLNIAIDKIKDINLLNSRGVNALMIACHNDRVNNVKILIEKKANLELASDWGSTALNAALYRANLDIVKMLIKAGACLNVKRSFFARGPLELVISVGGFAAISRDLSTEDLEAIKLDMVKLLVEAGVELNAHPYPLRHAIQEKNLEISKYLVKEGTAQVFKEDGGLLWWTALGQAILSESIDIFRMLIDEGVNIEEKDSKGETSLFIAIEMSNLIFLKELIELSANLNAQGKKGNTALIRAIDDNKTDAAKMLIEAKAKLDIQNKYEDTALMFAVRKKNFELVKMLIDWGANPAIKNCDGETAYDIASRKNYDEIKDLLG